MGGRVKGSGGSFQGKSRTVKAPEAAASAEGDDIPCFAVAARKRRAELIAYDRSRNRLVIG
jgi:hypothetical protein